jgi:hypothetical protein
MVVQAPVESDGYLHRGKLRTLPPAGLGCPLGYRGSFLWGELRGSGATTLATTESPQLDGGRILCRRVGFRLCHPLRSRRLLAGCVRDDAGRKFVKISWALA